MLNYVWIISSVLILNIVGIIFSLLKNKKQSLDYNNNILQPYKIFFYVGLGVFVLIVGLSIMGFILDTESSNLVRLLSVIGICLILLIPTYLMFFHLNYKITVYEDCFIYQNFWRKKRKIYFKDIVINYEKIYPQVREKQENGKTKLVFKLAGLLNNEGYFMQCYRAWKKPPKKKMKGEKGDN